MRLAVTGAQGFVGQAVVRAARDRGHQVVAGVRNPADPGVFPAEVEVRAVGDLAVPLAQSRALEGADAVIHLAGKVRPGPEAGQDAAASFMQANAALTENLAKAASAAGCERFVFASSLSVFGGATPLGVVLDDGSETAPMAPYGHSKLAAELALRRVASETGLCAISIRPPAVYGLGAASPFMSLARAVRLGLPLPFKGLRNSRNFIFVGNLAQAMVAAAESQLQGEFIVTDSPPLTMEELIVQMALAMGRSPRLFSVNARALERLLEAVAGPKLADPLLRSMVVDGARFSDLSGWRPTVAQADAFRLTFGAR